MLKIDLSKPESTRAFTVCVKSQTDYNLKNFSLYRHILSLEQLYYVIKLMLEDQRDMYLDLEKRYIFTETKSRKHTHTIQIFEFKDNRAVNSKSFGIKEFAYSANEIADCLETWFKRKMRERAGLKFKQGIVFETLLRCFS